MNDDKYLQNAYTGLVYKVMNDYLLQMSPWNDGDNRRIYEINTDEYDIITYQNACMIVNKQFNETDEEWEHRGKKFKARALTNKSLDEHIAMLNMLPSHYIKESKTLLTDFEILPDISEELKNVFGKPMDVLEKEIKETSPYKNFKSYKLVNFIAKADDDLRQELLAMQLIKFFDKIFKKENIQLKLHPYEILITSSSSGLLEFLQNTSSVDGIKKKMVTESKSLCLFYKKYFKENFEEAQINFTRSLAAYSLICYYLQIKDRHNGNIMVDMYGNIIHIDFGFILGISPGGINFENAPFKLTKEYVEIMGGNDSLYYQMYKDLMVKGMIICKKYVDDIVNIAEIMSKGSKMPCFYNKNTDVIFKKFRERFYPDKKDEDFIKIVDDMVNFSYDNFRTNQYDNYQKLTNGIIP
jgi:phosphatidylinositol 4-kinase